MPQQNTKVVTGRVRLSYVNLFEPRASGDNDKPKYSVLLLIPKTDKVTLGKIEAATKAAAQNGMHSKFGGSIPKNLATTLHDGDEESDLEKNPEAAGMMTMSVSSATKPGVVDIHKDEIFDSTAVYSGCYARVSLNAFPYNFNGKKGVSFALNHVQKLADGENLSGRTNPADDFDDLEDAESII